MKKILLDSNLIIILCSLLCFIEGIFIIYLLTLNIKNKKWIIILNRYCDKMITFSLILFATILIVYGVIKWIIQKWQYICMWQTC